MTTSTESVTEGRTEELAAGDRVVIVDAPSWVRHYFTGRSGRVLRVLPFPGGDVWVRFERPVVPWCDRMEPVEEFPFAPEQLSAA